MIAVDTNVLVAAHHLDAAWHQQALAWVRFFAEGEEPWGIPGNLVFDAQIAELCREHGVDRLLSEDRDFRRFPALNLVTLDVPPQAQ